MKKIKGILLAIGFAFILMGGYNITVFAEETVEEELGYGYFKYEDFTFYDLEDGNIYLMKYNGSSDKVVIPEEVEGKKVRYIDWMAFEGEDRYSSITFPASVSSINLDAKILAPDAKIIILGKDTYLYLDNCNVDKKVYVECEYGSAAMWVDNVEYIYRGACDISKAQITIENKHTTITDAQMGNLPEIEVKCNGKKLKVDEDYYLVRPYGDQITVGKLEAKIVAIYNDKTKVYGEKKFSYTISPNSTAGLRGAVNTTYNQVGLRWEKVKGVTGYEIYRLEKDSYKLVARVKGYSKNTYTDKKLKESTKYTYKVRTYKVSKGKRYYSKFSNVTEVYTLPKKAKTSGYTLTNKKINLKTPINNLMSYDGYNSNWTSPSEMHDFFDYKGKYTIAYSDDNYVYIQRYNTNLKHINTIKIQKKYPQVGDVIADNAGNYYIAWGKNDVAGKGNVVTFAISKYSYKGKHIKTTTLKSYDGYDGKEVFEAGNCVMAINGNQLVCSYAKQMYNGHQKNEIFAVNMKNMKRVKGYDYWVSHSFNQKIIATRDGGIVFGDHGDAYDRGFILNYNNLKTGKFISYIPFHFWGLHTNDMFHVNKTYAQLGNIGEVDTGYVLVGTSAKSMTSIAADEKQQLMLQIINPETKKSILKGSTRSGTCYGAKAKDTGIKWLTNYTDGSYATNSNMAVIDKDRIVVMWERYKDYEFVDSYYMILSSTGKILKNTTSLNKARLSGNEEVTYYKGCIYWTSAQYEYGYDWVRGEYYINNTVIHKLKVSNMK